MPVPNIFANQAGPIPLAELDANFSAFSGPTGSTLVSFTQAGVGAVPRTLQSRLQDAVNVVDFGADPTGVVDSTVAIQAAINYANSVGKDVEFDGTFLLSSPGITINNSTDTSFDGFRCSLIGHGWRQSILNFGAGNYTCVSVMGAAGVGADSGQRVENMIISKSDNLGTCLLLQQAAHMVCYNVRTSGGNVGWNLVNMQESTFTNCIATFANGGILATRSVGTPFTAPNALVFTGCTFGNCNTYGGDFQNCAAVSFVGCTFESNNNSAIGGTASTWGIRLIFNDDTSQQGTVGATFTSCYLENNGLNVVSPTATGDIWVVNSASPVSVTVQGCTFQRHSFFTTNCIRVDTFGGHHTWVNVNGCGFRGFADYTASASRPYILLSLPTDTVRIVAQGNEYANSLEAPVFTNQDNITPDFVPNAWVRFTGSTATINASANVSGLSRTSPGVYVITFAEPLTLASNFSYGLGLVGGAGFISVTAESATSITVTTLSTTGVAADFQCCVQVFGGGRMS